MRKFFIPTFFLIVIIIPLWAVAEVSSSTVPTAEQILNALRGDPALLQAVQYLFSSKNNGQTHLAPPCRNFSTNFGVGARGGDFDNLRNVLYQEGFFGGDDATFGNIAAASVKGLQEKYADVILKPLGLHHGTGYVGTVTRRWLNIYYGCNPKPFSPNVRVLSPNGGENWPLGSSQKIIWVTLPYSTFLASSSSNSTQNYTQTVSISLISTNHIDELCFSGESSCVIGLVSYIPNTGSFEWSVGSLPMWADYAPTIPIGKYFIQVCHTHGPVGTKEFCDQGDNSFSITAQ